MINICQSKVTLTNSMPIGVPNLVCVKGKTLFSADMSTTVIQLSCRTALLWNSSIVIQVNYDTALLWNPSGMLTLVRWPRWGCLGEAAPLLHLPSGKTALLCSCVIAPMLQILLEKQSLQWKLKVNSPETEGRLVDFHREKFPS